MFESYMAERLRRRWVRLRLYRFIDFCWQLAC
ncbi:hypothetical protein HmCmsJML153_01335 [Escherichia coli]|nr:hypothetical protein RX12_13881 [Escherichia coli]DAU99534.1 MAG TPA: hypothetical protein [Caudoviricetes sp.]OYB56681.1 hypothetical protein RX15_00926 [Escherichia coli]OYB69092.1 hypothetical protein RX13_00924 [Escherichia coli]OYB87922.1 hypothetical protein RX14_00795 [Escherichia coli]